MVTGQLESSLIKHAGPGAIGPWHRTVGGVKKFPDPPAEQEMGVAFACMHVRDTPLTVRICNELIWGAGIYFFPFWYSSFVSQDGDRESRRIGTAIAAFPCHASFFSYFCSSSIIQSGRWMSLLGAEGDAKPSFPFYIDSIQFASHLKVAKAARFEGNRHGNTATLFARQNTAPKKENGPSRLAARLNRLSVSIRSYGVLLSFKLLLIVYKCNIRREDGFRWGLHFFKRKCENESEKLDMICVRPIIRPIVYGICSDL